jgi:hypothetical protein
MKQLIAIHEVIRDGKNGKPEAIAPGKGFSAEDELAEVLLAAGAAKLDPATVAEQDGPLDLSSMKKDELIALAEVRQVAIDPTSTKAVIIAALEAAEQDSLV